MFLVQFVVAYTPLPECFIRGHKSCFIALMGLWLAEAVVTVALVAGGAVRCGTVVVMGVVVDRVVRVKKGSEIVTQAVLQIHQHIYGAEAMRFVTLEVPGGKLPNGLEAVVSGTPKLAVGDMVLGYFERHGDVFWPLGLAYGVLRVHLNSEGKAFVRRHMDGLRLIRGRDVSGRVQLLEQPEPLSTYLRRLGEIIGEPALLWSNEVRGW